MCLSDLKQILQELVIRIGLTNSSFTSNVVVAYDTRYTLNNFFN